MKISKILHLFLFLFFLCFQKVFAQETPGECNEDRAKFLIETRVLGSGKEIDRINEPAIKWLDYCIKEKGLNPNLQDKDGWTVPMMAAEYGQIETLKRISLHPQFDPNLQNNEGWTVVMLAIKKGHGGIAQEMILHPKFDPNARNKQGGTTSMLAVFFEQHETAQKIVLHPKYDPNLQQDFGWTAAMLAALCYPPESLPQLRSLLFSMLEKGALFEVLTDKYDENLLKKLEARGPKFSELARDLKNSLRGDGDPESSCAEEQLIEHISPFPESGCIICLDDKDFLLKAHPENPDCAGICGDCHQSYMSDCLTNAAVKDLVCPAQLCQKPLPISFMMAPHGVNRNLQKLSSASEIPVTEKEQIKKLLGLNFIKKSSHIPGYRPCHGENCPGYASEKVDGWFKCLLCHRERFLEEMDQDPGLQKFLAEGIAKGSHFRCPRCQTVIEKNGGCQHMTCTRCQHEFMVPSGQDFHKHCPFCLRKVTRPNVYDGNRMEEGTCLNPECGKKFQWDEAKTFQD